MSKQEEIIWNKPLGELTDKEWKIFLRLLEEKRENGLERKERTE